MYRLVLPDQPNSGSILNSPPIQCIYPDDVDNHIYGCGSESPDQHIQEPEGFFHVSEQYYLKNVLATEMDFAELSPDAEALMAQMIASRTVASWKSANGAQEIVTHDNGTVFKIINNSTQYQVFIPGTYNAYPDYQADIDAALNATQGQYLSAGDGHTIDAEFSSDMIGGSQDGGQTYLNPIQDPISTNTACTVSNGNLTGMSQKGAIRWAKGNECPDGTGAAWPVKWDYQQILAHYYTGIAG
jgi:peptidoglycan hydrolase-like amidase